MKNIQPQKDKVFHRTCKGKVRYRNIRSVKNVIKEFKKRMPFELDAYKCAFCGGWHLGNKKG